jgi:predicted transcriptional regulator
MAKSQRELPELTPAQGEIMEIVWERTEVSASEVRRILNKTRHVARNTVRTLLERMEEKGWVKHREEGRTFLYSAAQPRQATIGQKVQEMIETVCGGSPEALVSALLDYRGLSADELQRIRQMLAKARTDRDKKGGR